MNEIILSAAISFLVVLFGTPKWISRAKAKGLVGKDMNKHSKPEVAETGGIIVFLGFVSGLSVLIAHSLIFHSLQTAYLYAAVLLSLSLITLIAYLDDTGGWKRGFVRWKKPLLTAVAVLPLIPFISDRVSITLVGVHIPLPYLFYPLVLVPIGFVGATNAVNLLGGFNGLEAGLGAIASATLLWFSLHSENPVFFPLMLLGLVASLSFLIYNRYPSRVFPGDTYTYFLGGLLAIFAVLGQFQTATILIMAPYLLEGIIKSREIPYILRKHRPFKPECFGKVSKDNSIKEPYKEIWSLTHIIIKMIRKIKGKCYENDVTTTILTLYIAWCLFIVAVYIWVL